MSDVTESSPKKKARFIAITTVHDGGAAEVTREKLVDAGIPVELKSLGMNPYLGTVSAQQIEVRVPEDRLADAQLELDRLEEQVEAALLAEAGVPPGSDDDEDERGSMELPSVGERPLKTSWAIVLSWLLPFPAGCFYARSWKIGYLLCGLFIGGVAAPFIVHNGDAFVLAVIAKVADLVLAPFLVAAHNRRLAESLKSKKVNSSSDGKSVEDPRGAQS